MQLDLLDQQLVSSLDFGPRTGLKQIANQLGTTQQVLDYRLRNLQKRGFITGFYPVIDAFRLGYRYCRLFLQLSDLTPGQIKSIKQFASRNPSVLWCYRMEGDFNLVLVFWTKSLEAFEHLSHECMALVGQNVLSLNQNQVYQLDHYPVAQVLMKKPSAPLSMRESGEALDIDELDSHVLSTLSSDARQPFSSIAKQIKTSDKVVAYRIERLEERGVIRGYRPLIAWGVAGLLFFKLFIRLDHSKPNIVERFYSYIAKAPELLYTVRGIGAPGEVDIEVVVNGYSELFAFIDRLRAKFPGAIRSLSHYHFTECFKVNYFPF